MKCIVKYYDEYYSKYVRRVCVCLGGGESKSTVYVPLSLCLVSVCLHVCWCYVLRALKTFLKHFYCNAFSCMHSTAAK